MLCIGRFRPLLLFFFKLLTSSSATRLYRRWILRLKSENCTCCHTVTERVRPTGLSRSHYTDTEPTRRERDRTHDPLTRSCALYPQSYRAPRNHCTFINIQRSRSNKYCTTSSTLTRSFTGTRLTHHWREEMHVKSLYQRFNMGLA